MRARWLVVLGARLGVPAWVAGAAGFRGLLLLAIVRWLGLEGIEARTMGVLLGRAVAQVRVAP